MAIIEAKSPLLELFTQPQGHDVVKLEERRDDPPEPPEFEDPIDLPFDIADLAGLFGEKIAHALRQGGLYVSGITHDDAAF